MDLNERFLAGADGKSRESDDRRSGVAKDRDRLIHSSAFRRLQGKSQIVGVEVGDFFRTRITHSLECAQIGGAIARRVLTSPEAKFAVSDAADLPDVVEAACLAHDLGHPPFGHNGELALQDRMRHYDASLFEGNAQSFRIVTFSEPKVFGPTRVSERPRWLGLNLTRATLRALMKYPRVETTEDLDARKPKFGVYRDPDDTTYFEWIWGSDTPEKNLAARIMDVADDIAYAVHDFEDGVWAAMIPLHELLVDNEFVTALLKQKVLDPEQGNDGLFDEDEFAPSLGELLTSPQLEYLRKVGFDRTREAHAALKNYTAELIGSLIESVTPDGRFAHPSGEVARRIALLKGMAWQWMIERTDIETHQFGQRRLVSRVFDGYWERPEMLPRREEWRAIASKVPAEEADKRPWPEKARLIRDHIAGMTDGYAREVYDQMYRATQRRDLRLTY